MLKDTEDIFIEPSSCAAFNGPVNIQKFEDGQDYLEMYGLDDEVMADAAQICWATGGRLVPDEVWDKYMNTYL
jgi:D-serine dehydratase